MVIPDCRKLQYSPLFICKGSQLVVSCTVCTLAKLPSDTLRDVLVSEISTLGFQPTYSIPSLQGGFKSGLVQGCATWESGDCFQHIYRLHIERGSGFGPSLRSSLESTAPLLTQFLFELFFAFLFILKSPFFTATLYNLMCPIKISLMYMVLLLKFHGSVVVSQKQSLWCQSFTDRSV